MFNKVKSIDLRKIPYFERSEAVFNLWNRVKPGETMEITDDRNPKPLYHQFENKQHGRYEWLILRKEAKKWVVKIKKLNGGNHG